MDTKNVIGFIQKVVQRALDRTALRILIWLEDEPSNERIGPLASHLSLNRFNHALDTDQ